MPRGGNLDVILGMQWFDTCDCRTLNCGETLGGETLNCGETLTRGTKMDRPPERIINDSNVVHDEEIRLALEDPKVMMQLSEHSDLQWSPDGTKHLRVNRRAFTLRKLNAIKVDEILEPLEGQKNDNPVKRSCLVLDVPVRASRDKQRLQPGQGQSEVISPDQSWQDMPELAQLEKKAHAEGHAECERPLLCRLTLKICNGRIGYPQPIPPWPDPQEAHVVKQVLEGGGAFENTPPTTTAHSVHPGQAQGGDSHNAGSSGSAIAVYPVTPSLVEGLTEDCEWGIHEDLTYVFLLHSITEHVADMCNFAITCVTSWQKFAPTHCCTVQEWITEKAACQRTHRITSTSYGQVHYVRSIAAQNLPDCGWKVLWMKGITTETSRKLTTTYTQHVTSSHS